MLKSLSGGVAGLCLLSLTACNSGGVAAVNGAIGQAQNIIGDAVAATNTACGSAGAAAANANSNPLVAGNPTIQNLLGWLSGACGKAGATGAIVQAAANDPNGIPATAAWITNIVSQLKGVLG